VSRQREIPELVYLLEAGASHAQVINYTQKILDWAVETVATTPRQTVTESEALVNATRRLVAGKERLLDTVGLGTVPEKP